MRTGWEKYWMNKNLYLNRDKNGIMHFPGFSTGVVEFLINKRKINGIGVETLSVDTGISTNFEVHFLLFKNNKYALENLANLHLLPPSKVVLIIAPLKIENGSGSPARIFAIL